MQVYSNFLSDRLLQFSPHKKGIDRIVWTVAIERYRSRPVLICLRDVIAVDAVLMPFRSWRQNWLELFLMQALMYGECIVLLF